MLLTLAELEELLVREVREVRCLLVARLGLEQLEF